MTIIELGLLTALGFDNSPFARQTTVFPSLLVEHRPVTWAYVLGENQARCQPLQYNRWNPITTQWTVEGGFLWKGVQLGIGHKSEHGVGVDDLEDETESYDYVRLRYRITL